MLFKKFNLLLDKKLKKNFSFAQNISTAQNFKKTIKKISMIHILKKNFHFLQS